MSENNISQALEDARARYAKPETSQTEKSRREIIESIKVMLKEHPEMSNKDIALEVGGIPNYRVEYRLPREDPA